MTTQQEWDDLSQAEKDRRIQKFTDTIREILKPHDKETIRTALTSIIKDLNEAG